MGYTGICIVTLCSLSVFLGELRIGRGNPAGYFTGTIDDVAIFRVALSEDEVRSIMSKGLASAMSVEPQGKLVETWGNIRMSQLRGVSEDFPTQGAFQNG